MLGSAIGYILQETIKNIKFLGEEKISLPENVIFTGYVEDESYQGVNKFLRYYNSANYIRVHNKLWC